MYKNLSLTDRYIRSLIAVALVINGLLFPFPLWYTMVLLVIAGYLLFTVWKGFSPLYHITGKNTARDE